MDFAAFRRPGWRRTLVLAGVLYVLLCGFLYLIEPLLVFSPLRKWQATPADLGVKYEDVALVAADGVRTHGWWIAREGAAWTVLYLHGNGGNISSITRYLVSLEKEGFAVLALEYRGYGRAEGEPSEDGLYADADAAWIWLEERGVPRERVIVWGQSLGGGVASNLAEKHSPRVLVLESTFTSIPDVGKHRFPFAPVRTLVRHDFDTRSRLENIESAFVVAHGQADWRVPYRLGRELFETAREPKVFLELEGGHENGILDSPAAIAGLHSFLDGLAP